MTLSRRKFLIGAGTTLAAVALPLPALPAVDRGKQAALLRQMVKQYQYAKAYGAGPKKLHLILNRTELTWRTMDEWKKAFPGVAVHQSQPIPTEVGVLR